MNRDSPASLRLRPATIEDARLLHKWVNALDSLGQKNKTCELIPWPVHKRWCEARVDDPGCLMEIAEIEGNPAGQVRLELKTGGHHVDIYIVPEQRGRGIAHVALQDVLSRVSDRPLIAEVRRDNAASLRLFLGLGFRETGQELDLVTLKLEE